MALQDSQQRFHWHYSELDDDRIFQIRGHTFLFAAVLFSVLLLLLLLYARWICRFRHSSARHAAHAPPPPSHHPGLDAATINSFQIVLHKSATTATRFGVSECCICLGMFEDAEKVKVLPNCRHCFHCECVDKWLCSHTSCPLCRSSLRSDSPV